MDFPNLARNECFRAFLMVRNKGKKSRTDVAGFLPKQKTQKIAIPSPAMKWFCPIFSLYLLVLSCLPCNDGEHGHGQSAANPVQISASTDQHGCPQHQQCDDSCSPLCGCHCCSAVFVFQKTTALIAPRSFVSGKKHLFPDRCFLVKDMAFAIDHPPQLS